MPAYLIDASIYIFQAHFSPNIECYDADGEDLGALYGFSQFLLQFLRRQNPRVAAVAMDESLFCGFRHQLCEKYKANRELPDENLSRQLAGCAELSRIMGLPTFASKKYEADDIIGTLARRLREADTHLAGCPREGIGIVSRDKDLAQLLHGEMDFVWDYQRNRKRFIPQVVEDFGVYPVQIPDYLGLVGDAVDNISGVPGVGPVKGKHLLQEFADLDAIYSDIDQVRNLSLRGSEKLALLLHEHKGKAYLSKRLATIVDNVVDEAEEFSIIPLKDLERKPADTERLAEFLAAEKFDDRFCDRMVNTVSTLNNSFF
ncbi:MAG: hypothetical protein JKY98_08915 [Gammaproteobacteria bacterium]|nr:hypothetical protein [Gammaproteobacteria bacterium]